ncbi:MAG: methylated-DNA--[protein]-cysteine S-methyltransferase, partial [Acidimicrobiales bacterium]
MSSSKVPDLGRRGGIATSSGAGYTLFETAVGRCAIVWSSAGVTGVQLPEPSVADTRRRVVERHPGAVEAEPPPSIRKASEAIARHLAKDPSDLSWIRLDMDRLSSFEREVYEQARSVPTGATVSYGGLAERLGRPGAARAVGQALKRNPFAVVVPCHRVVAAGGGIGGFSAGGGTDTKRRILEIEGAVPILAMDSSSSDSSLAEHADEALAGFGEHAELDALTELSGGAWELPAGD